MVWERGVGMNRKIVTNKTECKRCGDIIESTYRHDFRTCKCGAVYVDGGKDYLRRRGKREDWKDKSVWEIVSE